MLDLEAAGIGIIQIDEPALREGLPLRRAPRGDLSQWAARAFRVSTSGVASHTQMHLHIHLGHAEFNDILPEIAVMDADVITVEAGSADLKVVRGVGDFCSLRLGPDYQVTMHHRSDSGAAVKHTVEAAQHLWEDVATS